MRFVQKGQIQGEEAMEKALDITNARQQFATMVDQVRYKKDSYIILKRGEPAAVLVPLDVYEVWKREREQLFAAIRRIQEENPRLIRMR